MRLALRALSRALAPLTVAATLSCGGGDGGTKPVAVASVELSATTVSLAPGASTQLTATARASSGAAIADRTFSWAVVSNQVATVSASGLVTGVADGTTTVTVSIEGKSAAATVTVRTPVASVVVTPPTAEVTIGGAPAQLTATARDGSGATLAGRTIAWSSSSATVATVSQAGTVTGIAVGSATISAESEGRTGTAVVSVIAANPCLTARTITLGQTFSGSLVAADCRLADNSALQLFTFTLAAASVLEIEMTSAAVDPYLFVLDANRNPVAEDDDGGAGSNARVLRSFAAGTYFILANTYDANSFGAYQLALRLAPAACTTGRPTALPAAVTASLGTTTSCRLNDDSFFDRYELNVTTRTTVRMDMTSTAIDPFLVVYDPTGQLVAQDDDAGGGVNAHIEVQLEAGRYAVLGIGLPNQLGTYRLDITTAVDPCAVTRTVNIGQTVNSTLTTTDCATGSQGPIPFTQRFALSVPTAGALQIDMVSSAVDAYLIIQNAATGAVVAENDDFLQGSTNSRVSANFAPGQYIVNATTFDIDEVGGYSLTVASISPTTPVTIAVSPTTLALASGQQQQLTATVGGTANTGVTWQTSQSSVATVTTAGLVRAVTPGTATITARAAADPSKLASIPVTVTQSAGGAPNLDIGAMYLIQSVQQLDGSVRLVANRDAIARVFLRGSRTGIGSTAVRVRLFQGASLLQTLQGNAAPTLTLDEGCCSADIVIPGSLIRAGVSVLVDADPQNVIAESNETDNTFPLSGTAQPLNVATVPDFNIRLVPVRQNRSGQIGVATQALLTPLRSIWPLATVNGSARTALAIDYTLVSTSFDEWSFLVRDLELTRRTDGATGYYYGLVRINYTQGVLGLAGGIPALSAVGIDEGTPFGPVEARFTLAHEMGHAIGLRHAPCGGAAGPDPAFPFADGRSGAFGIDMASGNVIKQPNGTDIMGYCENQWVSVYNYRNVFDIRARNPNGVVATAATEVLMISGAIDRQRARIDGSFALHASPTSDDPAGRFVLEGISANGSVLFSQRFSPFTVSDGRPDDEAFVLAVPVTEQTKAALSRLTVRELNGARQGTRAKSATPVWRAGDAGISTMRSAAGALRLRWSATEMPMVMVRDPATGMVLGIGRTGDLDLSQFEVATDVDVLVTDGVTSLRRSVNPRTGAVRP